MQRKLCFLAKKDFVVAITIHFNSNISASNRWKIKSKNSSQRKLKKLVLFPGHIEIRQIQ